MRLRLRATSARRRSWCWPESPWRCSCCR
jgi:hypothetical protein